MKIPFIGDSPIRKNMFANLFGFGVQLINQIVLVPFYIFFWGKDLYGDWIVISALATIFSMSDKGLNNVIQNQFAIKLSEGNQKECKSLLTNNYILIIITFFVSLLLVFAFVSIWDITHVMKLHLLTRDEANLVFIILLAKVFIGMLCNVEDAIYRATHNASVATYMNQFGILACSVITIICILLKTDIVILCILICTPQIILSIIKYFHSRGFFNYVFDLKYADLALFKRILLPSFTFMSFPISNAIILQGYTLIVNSFFGADAVVLYNTTRTLCNSIKSFISTLQSAVWPEYSIAYGNGDYNLMRHLHRKIMKFTILLSILMGIALLIFGPFIYKVWTQGTVTFNCLLMVAYIVALITESLWTSSAVTLMSTNNHSKLGAIFLISSLTAICLALIVAYTYPHLWAIAMTLVLLHAMVCCYTIKAGMRLTQGKLTCTK